jgi:hypothetical protein
VFATSGGRLIDVSTEILGGVRRGDAPPPADLLWVGDNLLIAAFGDDLVPDRVDATGDLVEATGDRPRVFWAYGL